MLQERTNRTPGWIWLTPFLVALLPAWMAWALTCPIPHADHWNMFAVPYLKWSHGASLWGQIHEQGNDSRYDVPRLLNFFLVKTTHWDLRVESLTCVALALLIALCLICLLRHSPAKDRVWMGAVTVLGVFLVLTPHQWMNWTFSVQTCYMLSVLGSVLVVAIFQTSWPLWWRALLAGICGFVATHSFLNGWFAWGLGTACLGREFLLRGSPRSTVWLALATWIALLAVTISIFAHDYAPSHVIVNLTNPARDIKYPLGIPLPDVKELALKSGQTPAAEEVPRIDPPPPLSKAPNQERTPMAFATFFFTVLGAPFSEGWPIWDRSARYELNEWLAPLLSSLALVLLGCALWAGWRGAWKGRGAQVWPFLLLIGYGLANAGSITYARTGLITSGPFQSRYIAFTLWFHVGLIVLLGCMESRFWRWVRWAWMLVLAYGCTVGGIQGVRDGERDFQRNQIMTAAAAMRHVAVEPTYLESVNPDYREGSLALMDELDALGLFHVPTLHSELVQDAQMSPADMVKGELRAGEQLPDGRFFLRGWAMDARTGDVVDAIAVSSQIVGGKETWLGLAQRRLTEGKLAAHHHAHTLEQRIGWAYSRGFINKRSFLSNQPLPYAAKALPAGKVIFRAYAFNVTTGQFCPLAGGVETVIPGVPPEPHSP